MTVAVLDLRVTSHIMYYEVEIINREIDYTTQNISILL